MNSTPQKATLSSHFFNISLLLKKLKFSRKLIAEVLFLYYLVTILCALLEGASMLLLVNIFTGGSSLPDKNSLMASIFDLIVYLGGNPQFPELVPFLIAMFSINLLLRFGLLSFNGYLGAVFRKRVQSYVFTSYLKGDWSHMRDFRVGKAVGTNTFECMAVTKYLISAVQTLYFLIFAVVITGVAFWTSLEVSIIMGCIALPLMLLMRKIGVVLSKFSRLWTDLRNQFSSDITDRFNGLLQIHVDDNYDYHLRQGLNVQDRFTRLEVLQGFFQAGMGSFTLLLPLTALIGFSIWSFFAGNNAAIDLSLVASVGVLGVRVATQLNAVVAGFGSLSRLYGSLFPVFEALGLPPVPKRQIIDEPVVSIQADKICYSYGDSMVINEATFLAERGTPLVLSGRSGRGKTTLANMVAGLYFPSKGQVIYTGTSGKKFFSKEYRAKVGFVTQDIYLFHGSLLSNLASGRELTDEQIWAALEQVDAADFVKEMGGLDTESTEAGRSLSGGQRRRLGIARVLLSNSDILIFDEITSGLDRINKNAVLKVIERLSEKYIVLVISHEELSLSNQVTYSV